MYLNKFFAHIVDLVSRSVLVADKCPLIEAEAEKPLKQRTSQTATLN